MKRPTFQRIGVVVNLDKGPLDAFLGDFVPEMVRQGFSVFVDPEIEPHLLARRGIEIGIPPDCDLIVAYGGDGTILKVARKYLDTPILGLKGGRLGFLTEPMHRDVVTRLKNHGYKIQERMRISATITATTKRRAAPATDLTALNDVVVHGGATRMVTLRTEVDGVFVREYSADGVIVATPTGSTAYSLSAGGPILNPTLHAMLLTPLCPHKLSIRPVVVDARERVTVSVVSPRDDIRVTVDGQESTNLEAGEKIVIEKSEKTTKLVVPEDYDFFSMLREKL